MTDRERLIDLIIDAKRTDPETGNFTDYLADYLLEHGVIVPHCKVRQTVWFIRNKEIIETCVEKIILKHGGLYIKLCCNSMYETTCNSIGKTVFLTREEAEKALKERDGA